MFTAELAVGMLAVTPLVVALLMLVAAGSVQVRVTEAARTGTRMLVRGDSDQLVRDEIRAMLPGATVVIERAGGRSAVEVLQAVGGGGMLPGFTLRAKVSGADEVGRADG